MPLRIKIIPELQQIKLEVKENGSVHLMDIQMKLDQQNEDADLQSVSLLLKQSKQINHPPVQVQKHPACSFKKIDTQPKCDEIDWEDDQQFQKRVK
ncbi:unnamed protein product (macronuclear) [Paramecium tetraurelia]|uniref:Uncharacterized protein n=1 Tax=Paramecium tetraurelia TaxID=5888 RepID=A0EBS3_PARTE|nr:uncharacterized protein GSPATT00025474001 [Paramecium tetraurelia]CAK92740.1 unnamed protein product [Paramecium tetraurelia]|eukprot:XP_001460137.1 hypothetical protein (macronuclear) [Paramecium tetraurelia strain d4-2]